MEKEIKHDIVMSDEELMDMIGGFDLGMSFSISDILNFLRGLFGIPSTPTVKYGVTPMMKYGVYYNK